MRRMKDEEKDEERRTKLFIKRRRRIRRRKVKLSRETSRNVQKRLERERIMKNNTAF